MKTKSLTLLILLIGLIACNSKKSQNDSKILFDKGISEMSKIELGSINNDYSTAINLFSESIYLDKNNFAAQYWKMFCEIKMNRLIEAKKTFQNAIKNGLNDNDKLAPEFYVSAGLIDKINKINSTENFDKADRIYSSRIKKDKNDIDAIAQKSTIYCYLDKKADAIAFIDSMIEKVDSSSILINFKTDLISFDSEKALNEMINK